MTNPDEPWRAFAACIDADDRLFFAPGESGEAVETTAPARRICAGCPVKSDCLEYALETNQRFGIWGGLTPDERRPLRRRLIIAGRKAS
jgi:WhiB family redox-sensing transcriptional regulator